MRVLFVDQPYPLFDTMDSNNLLACFDEAVSALQPGQLIHAPNATVFNMMSAIEIGDSRVDAGMLSEAQRNQPSFDPYRLLLPEELLLVMDDLMRCEVNYPCRQIGAAVSVLF